VRKPEQIIAQLKQIGYEVSDVEGSADDDEAK
jgi:hypothetical protein